MMQPTTKSTTVTVEIEVTEHFDREGERMHRSYVATLNGRMLVSTLSPARVGEEITRMIDE